MAIVRLRRAGPKSTVKEELKGLRDDRSRAQSHFQVQFGKTVDKSQSRTAPTRPGNNAIAPLLVGVVPP